MSTASLAVPVQILPRESPVAINMAVMLLLEPGKLKGIGGSVPAGERVERLIAKP